MYKLGCVVSHPAAMMRKKDFEDVGKYNENIGRRFNDYYLWMKFLKRGYSIANLPQVLIKYRLINNAISSAYYLSAEGKKYLLKVMIHPDPSTSQISELYRHCIPLTNGAKSRMEEANRFQNKLFAFLKFLGTERISSFISFSKNIAIYFFI